MELDNSTIDFISRALYDASKSILEVYQSEFKIELKDDQSPVTKADKYSSEILTKALEETKITIVSEEEHKPKFEERSKAEYIWLVDPLDGTKEFIRRNDEFSINIALVKNGKPHFGFIADPVKGQLLLGSPNDGAFQLPLNKSGFNESQHRIKRNTTHAGKGLIFSRSHFSPGLTNLLARLEERYGTLRLIKKGSALKFFDLTHGQADFYPRMAPTMEWDIAAGDAIFRGVGGEVLNFTNFESLVYNKSDLRNPHFIAKPVSLNIH